MLRIQVMLALQRLVVALGPASPICYPNPLPILQYSTDISQPDELNMLEDGLHLSTAQYTYLCAQFPCAAQYSTVQDITVPYSAVQCMGPSAEL